jgi:hypothetical protein
VRTTDVVYLCLTCLLFAVFAHLSKRSHLFLRFYGLIFLQQAKCNSQR